MPVIVVANPKGGVGKSTLSTQIAGLYASQGHAVMLGDVDRQQSSRIWLGLRPANLPEIRAWEVTHGEVVRPPRGTTHVVLDTPAGLHNKRLDEVMKIADKVLVPLQPFALGVIVYCTVPLVMPSVLLNVWLITLPAPALAPVTLLGVIVQL